MRSKQTLLREKYDAVIIGSGPAGASAAKALTGHGLETVIIEKAKLPRYKMCSGILSPTSIKYISDNFGEIPHNAFSTPVEVIGYRAYPAVDKPVLDMPLAMLDSGPGLPEMGMSVKRPEFDHWLCTKSDADIVDQCRFKTFQEQNGEIVLILEHDGEERRIATKYLVGADGPLSRVRKSISPDVDRTLRLIPNYEEWYVGEIDLEPGWLHLFFDHRVTSYFATVFHKDGNIVAVTGAKQTESAKEYFQEFVSYLKESHGLVIEERTASDGCVLHDMSATDNFFFGNENVLLTGEAGGFNRCAEGIGSALVTGRAAGEGILSSIDKGTSALGFYSESVSAEVEACKKASQLVAEAVGVNPFTR